MHNRPLHQPVAVECLCCRVRQEFIFTSTSDQVVCKGCLRHQGDTTAKAKQRDFDHVSLWQSELLLAKEVHAREVAGLRSIIAQRDQELTKRQIEINDLRRVVSVGLETAPLPSVERWWANEQVAAAMKQRDDAYRSRGHAYRALWAVDRLHHDDSTRDGYCACGKRSSKCRELEVVASTADSLTKWETRQIDRLRRDLPDELPDTHPEVLKHRGYGRYRGWNHTTG